jgi:DNA-binding response OmpR family regulator
VKVLLVDDDPDIRDITAYALQREGFRISLAGDGRQALESWEKDPPDVVLLDARMPKLDGLEVLRTIRLNSETPVIMVTARNQEEEIVRGFQLGADDYVTKPFSPKQLIARIKAVVRRAHNGGPDPSPQVTAAGIVFDVESHEARRGELRVRMTPLEARILHTLLINAGRVVSTSRLVDQGWGYDGGDASTLKNHISHMRRKLQLRIGEPGYIEGIPSVGYLLHT